ncbi:hypothetical protein KC351_g10097 [Hortaea werneckii]|nr:hypothetical protein KC351_g10097 [Hortaea werneckii]
MSGPDPVFKSRAPFVIDVQQDLIAGPEAVPDAVEVHQAIHDVLEPVRHHNDTAQLNNKLSKRVKIVFAQHNDKDPEDPMYKGKSTWELTFSPREDDDAERLVFKDVDASRSYARIKRDVEEEMAGLGVRLQGWRDFAPLDM